MKLVCSLMTIYIINQYNENTFLTNIAASNNYRKGRTRNTCLEKLIEKLA